MKIEITIRNDLEMPLGKTAAQCAHAFNMALIQRMAFRQIGECCVLRPTMALRQALSCIEDIDITLSYTDKAGVIRAAESSEAVIVDSGRTVFDGETLTVSWSTDGLGDPVAVDDQVPFVVDAIAYKQPIFVNRANAALNDEAVIQLVARHSTLAMLNGYDPHTNELRLSADAPLLQWLQDGIGKTVVGCKKLKNYRACTQLITVEQGDAFSSSCWGEEVAVLAFAPLSAEVIERYTRNRHARLLDHL